MGRGGIEIESDRDVVRWLLFKHWKLEIEEMRPVQLKIHESKGHAERRERKCESTVREKIE